MTLEEAWAIVKAMPKYFHEPDEGPGHLIIMNDVWGWACADGLEVNDANVQRIAELFCRYGFGGLLYYQGVEVEGGSRSEFADNNRMLDFVTNEERIRKEVPESNKRAYFKTSYVVGEAKP